VTARRGIAVTLTDVRVVRGSVVVLDGSSLTVPAGGALGIVGANGAGKTTVLDVVSGLVSPERGEISFDGADASSWSPQRRYRAGVRRMFQESRLYPQMTAGEVLRVPSRSVGRTGASVSDAPPADTTYVSELSTGQRRLLDLAAATDEDARLLLLDEPTAGVAPEERARLIDAIRSWRTRTGGTLIVVEHDRSALERIVDHIMTLTDPAPASVRSMNGALAATEAAVAPRVGEIVANIAATKRPATALRPSGPSVWALARFGLREFAAGMLSVLTLGVLNRVMKVDLGIPLAVVAPILAAYNLAAPVALFVGARSDSRPVRGLYRTPYILAGAVLMAVTATLAPFVAWGLGAGVGPVTVIVGVCVFAAMGAGMYGSGATYFALLSEVVSTARERAVAVVYSMLMAGILAGVALSAFVLPSYDAYALLSLFSIVALLIVVCTWWAIRGAEGRDAPITTAPTIRARTFVGNSHVKRFFVFMVAITFFAFLQQAILEPYGGDVFGLNVRATTSFNAIQIIGVLVGMAVAARVVVPLMGRRGATAAGSIVAAIGLLAIAAAAIGPSMWLLYAGIAAMGLGLGLLNVGSLSLMLDMTAGHTAGLAMGLWTVAHAIADGAATASGGALQTLATAVLGADASGYGVVFVFEAIGLAGVLALLARVDPDRFKQEFTSRASIGEGGRS
jgi:BCD family chlorophyll transporter-like MFS transporter